MCIRCHILYNICISKVFLWVLWASVANQSIPRRGVMGTPIYNRPQPVFAMGIWNGGPSYGTELSTYGTWRYFQVSGVKIELNFRTPSWSLLWKWLLACYVEKPPPTLCPSPSITYRSQVVCVMSIMSGAGAKKWCFFVCLFVCFSPHSEFNF